VVDPVDLEQKEVKVLILFLVLSHQLVAVVVLIGQHLLAVMVVPEEAVVEQTVLLRLVQVLLAKVLQVELIQT
jgi:hypothetical protein